MNFDARYMKNKGDEFDTHAGKRPFVPINRPAIFLLYSVDVTSCVYNPRDGVYMSMEALPHHRNKTKIQFYIDYTKTHYISGTTFTHK